MLRAGIVGLPNVGKSTLFNAVTRTRNAQVAPRYFELATQMGDGPQREAILASAMHEWKAFDSAAARQALVMVAQRRG